MSRRSLQKALVAIICLLCFALALGVIAVLMIVDASPE
jgi:hypothetical protein